MECRICSAPVGAGQPKWAKADKICKRCVCGMNEVQFNYTLVLEIGRIIKRKRAKAVPSCEACGSKKAEPRKHPDVGRLARHVDRVRLCLSCMGAYEDVWQDFRSAASLAEDAMDALSESEKKLCDYGHKRWPAAIWFAEDKRKIAENWLRKK